MFVIFITYRNKNLRPLGRLATAHFVRFKNSFENWKKVTNPLDAVINHAITLQTVRVSQRRAVTVNQLVVGSIATRRSHHLHTLILRKKGTRLGAFFSFWSHPVHFQKFNHVHSMCTESDRES